MENANSIEVTENLIQKMRNSDAAIRNDAIKTLSARTDIETIRLLLPHLKDRRGDGRFYEDIVSILRRIKNPLIQAVQKYSNNRWDTNAYTLRAFLYSGNTKLSSAALSLARQQGCCLRCENNLLRDIFCHEYGEVGKIYPWGGKEPGKGYGCDA